MSDLETVSHDADIVLLTVAQSEVEGMMLADTVRSAGIQVLIKAGGPGMGAWASTATFEHRLYVRADRLEEARALINASDSGQASSGARGRRKVPHTNRRSRHTPE